MVKYSRRPAKNMMSKGCAVKRYLQVTLAGITICHSEFQRLVESMIDLDTWKHKHSIDIKNKLRYLHLLSLFTYTKASQEISSAGDDHILCILAKQCTHVWSSYIKKPDTFKVKRLCQWLQ